MLKAQIHCVSKFHAGQHKITLTFMLLLNGSIAREVVMSMVSCFLVEIISIHFLSIMKLDGGAVGFVMQGSLFNIWSRVLSDLHIWIHGL